MCACVCTNGIIAHPNHRDSGAIPFRCDTTPPTRGRRNGYVDVRRVYYTHTHETTASILCASDAAAGAGRCTEIHTRQRRQRRRRACVIRHADEINLSTGRRRRRHRRRCRQTTSSIFMVFNYIAPGRLVLLVSAAAAAGVKTDNIYGVQANRFLLARVMGVTSQHHIMSTHPHTNTNII